MRIVVVAAVGLVVAVVGFEAEVGDRDSLEGSSEGNLEGGSKGRQLVGIEGLGTEQFGIVEQVEGEGTILKENIDGVEGLEGPCKQVAVICIVEEVAVERLLIEIAIVFGLATWIHLIINPAP